jgi:glycosyltransferase involved in cell wall biosynthesis
MTTNNKILLVAYHFPPDPAVGAIRPGKFVKFLEEYGWESHVLTIEEEFVPQLTKAASREVQEPHIYRTDVWRSPLQIALDFRNKRRSSDNRNDPGEPQDKQAVDVAMKERASSFSLLKKTLTSLNFLPDSRMYWTIPAVRKGLEVIRRENIQYIFATAPPFTASVVGMILARLTGAKLVADFRDPWTLFSGRKPADAISPLSESIDRWLERTVIKAAAAVTTTTDKYTDALRSRYPNLPADKFHTIYNGFDRADIDIALSNQRDNGKFTLSYVGTFYLDRNPKSLFQAVSELMEEGVFTRDNLEIRLVGQTNKANGVPVTSMVSEYKLEGIVNSVGLVPYHEALSHMSCSSVLLLMAPNQYYQIPGKTFEYLGLRRPILGLLDEGATADVVRRFNAGPIVAQNDVAGIKVALKRLFEDYKGGGGQFGNYNPEEFDRKNLTRQLVEILVGLDKTKEEVR